mmetsp:Transcript_45502/g.97281  ORF Transcript_45502/g.97281 Transcript_45502/m.97281 type:complete len:240 (-) Transcript_45502:409-1128(-)
MSEPSLVLPSLLPSKTTRIPFALDLCPDVLAFALDLGRGFLVLALCFCRCFPCLTSLVPYASSLPSSLPFALDLFPVVPQSNGSNGENTSGNKSRGNNFPRRNRGTGGNRARGNRGETNVMREPTIVTFPALPALLPFVAHAVSKRSGRSRGGLILQLLPLTRQLARLLGLIGLLVLLLVRLLVRLLVQFLMRLFVRLLEWLLLLQRLLGAILSIVHGLVEFLPTKRFTMLLHLLLVAF